MTTKKLDLYRIALASTMQCRNFELSVCKVKDGITERGLRDCLACTNFDNRNYNKIKNGTN